MRYALARMTLADVFSFVLVLIGAFFVLVGSLGLARFPDFFTRLHGPTKATTLGLGALIAGFIVHAAGTPQGLSVRELLVSLFLFITAPVSAHILSRAALKRRVHSVAEPPESLDARESERPER